MNDRAVCSRTARHLHWSRLLWAACALLCCAQADAIQLRRSIEGLDVAIYGPDWTWQGRDINVLVVFTNATDAPIDAEATLRLPADGGEAFGRFGQPHDWTAEERTRAVAVPPGAVVREAFAGLTAMTDAPLGEYGLAVDLAVGDARDTAAYPVRIVRGAAVRGGRWAALGVPAAIALVWCAAFVIVLGRQARPGAWRTPPPALDEPANAPSWITESRS